MIKGVNLQNVQYVDALPHDLIVKLRIGLDYPAIFILRLGDIEGGNHANNE